MRSVLCAIFLFMTTLAHAEIYVGGHADSIVKSNFDHTKKDECYVDSMPNYFSNELRQTVLDEYAKIKQICREGWIDIKQGLYQENETVCAKVTAKVWRYLPKDGKICDTSVRFNVCEVNEE